MGSPPRPPLARALVRELREGRPAQESFDAVGEGAPARVGRARPGVGADRPPEQAAPLAEHRLERRDDRGEGDALGLRRQPEAAARPAHRLEHPGSRELVERLREVVARHVQRPRDLFRGDRALGTLLREVDRGAQRVAARLGEQHAGLDPILSYAYDLWG
jgi:hypothetical protein